MKCASDPAREGGASAAEVLELVEHVRAEVLKKQGVRLETEVQILGEEAS